MKKKRGNSLVVQSLGAHAFIAEGLGSIPGGETKIPQATWGEKKEKKRKRKRKRVRANT